MEGSTSPVDLANDNQEPIGLQMSPEEVELLWAIENVNSKDNGTESAWSLPGRSGEISVTKATIPSKRRLKEKDGRINNAQTVAPRLAKFELKTDGIIGEMLRSVQVSFFQISDLGGLKAAMDRCRAVDTHSRNGTDKNCCALYASWVLRWRIRGAEIKKHHQILNIDMVLKDITEFREVLSSEDFPFVGQNRRDLYPEIQDVESHVSLYENWLNTYSEYAEKIEAFRSRSRDSRNHKERLTADGDAQERRAEKEDCSANFSYSKRFVDYESFTTMLGDVERIGLISSSLVSYMKGIPPLLRSISANADTVLKKLLDDVDKTSTDFLSPKVLSGHYHRMSTLASQWDLLPVRNSVIEKVESFRNVYEWCKRATNLLVKQRSRSSLLETGTTTENMFIEAKELSLDEIENLVQTGADLNELWKRCFREESILRERLKVVTDLSREEKLKFEKALESVHALSLACIPAPEFNLIDPEKNIGAMQNSLDELKSLVNNHEITSTCAWFFELQVAPLAMELLQYFVDGVALLAKVKAPLASAFDSNGNYASHSNSADVAEKVKSLESFISLAMNMNIFSSVFKNKKNCHVKSFEFQAYLSSSDPNQRAYSYIPCAGALLNEMKSICADTRSRLEALESKWCRSLVNRYVDVQWGAGEWYVAKVAAYLAAQHMHIVFYSTKEVEFIRFLESGSAQAPDGETFLWKFSKTSFYVDDRDLNDALVAIGTKRSDTSDADKDEIEDNEPLDRKTAFEKDTVGKFIKVEWSRGQYYLGFVQRYDQAKRLHFVLYEDGASEIMRVCEDGTAIGESGDDVFHWVSTSEVFDIGAADDGDFLYESEAESEGDSSDYDVEDTLQPALKRKKQKADPFLAKKAENEKDSENKATVFQDGNRRIVRRIPKEKVESKKSIAKIRRKIEDEKMNEMRLAAERAEQAAIESKRTNARLLFEKGFKLVAEAAPESERKGFVNVSDLARELETELFEQSGAAGLPARVRAIYSNLKKNAPLNFKLLRKEVEPKELCSMDHLELAGEALKDKVNLERNEITELNTVKMASNGAMEGQKSKKLSTLAKEERKPDSIRVSESSQDVSKAQQGEFEPSGKRKEVHVIDQKLAEISKSTSSREADILRRILERRPKDTLENKDFSETRFDSLLGDVDKLADVSQAANDAKDSEKHVNGKKQSASNPRTSKHSKDSTKANRDAPPESCPRQCLQWSGVLRDGKFDRPINISLRALKDGVKYGAMLKDKHRLDASCVVGILGEESNGFKVSGRVSTSKGWRYFEDILKKSARQINVAAIIGSRGEGISEYLTELKNADRVALLDQGKGGLQVYLVPRERLEPNVCLEKVGINPDWLGIAVFCVKPTDVPNLTQLLGCRPVSNDFCFTDPRGQSAPIRSVSTAPIRSVSTAPSAVGTINNHESSSAVYGTHDPYGNAPRTGYPLGDYGPHERISREYPNVPYGHYSPDSHMRHDDFNRGRYPGEYHERFADVAYANTWGRYEDRGAHGYMPGPNSAFVPPPVRYPRPHSRAANVPHPSELPSSRSVPITEDKDKLRNLLESLKRGSQANR